MTLPFINMSLPIALLLAIFLLTAIRKVGPIQFPIWLLMCLAAVIVLLTDNITVKQAVRVIDVNILAYLFSVFVIAEALEKSNYLESVLVKRFAGNASSRRLIRLFIVFFSFLSIILMNDTSAIVGVPVIALLCQRTKLPALPFLLVLAFTATISSVVSPIGNPQNLLIASSLHEPFLHFLMKLTVPTIINLVVLYIYVLVLFRKSLKGKVEFTDSHISVDRHLARLGKISVFIMVSLIVLQLMADILHHPVKLPFGVIALISALPIILFAKQRVALITGIDWKTLLFFVGIFIFIEAVWLTNYFQSIIDTFNLDVTQNNSIVGISLVLSPLISNVPLVALYLPLIKSVGVDAHLILAMSSTLAGNLVILGAASNVIIVQNCEKRAIEPFGFIQFMLYGIPLTFINVLVYLLFF